MRNLAVSITVSLIVAGCGGGGGSSNSTSTPASTTSTTKSPVITLTLNRNSINQLQNAILTWNVSDATTCSGTQGLSGSLPVSGSKTVGYNSAAQTFELTCTGPGGTTSKSVVLNSSKPEYSVAGTWYPVAPESTYVGYDGNLASTFTNILKIGNGDNYGVAITGWGYKGWDNTNQETAIVNIGLFEPNSNGLLTKATSKYIDNPSTHGGASVIVTDINNDRYDDMVFVSHNETPIAPRPGTVFYGSSSGKFTKEIISDQIAAHDAQFSDDDGKIRILTSVVTGHPRNAYYESIGNKLVSVKVPGISFNRVNWIHVGNMSQTIVTNKNGDKVLVTAGGCRDVVTHPRDCPALTINTFPYNGQDITSYTPAQSITPYLSTLPEYSQIKAMDGVGQTHVYRVWSIDLNNDGHEDVLSAQNMWEENTQTFPVALQVLMNDGQNKFVDKTKTLNQDMPTKMSHLDPSPLFFDIDNSGIKTLFFSQMAFNNNDTQSNSIVLNDGTGKLYVAVNKEFESIAKDLYTYVDQNGITLPSKTFSVNSQFPKFIAVPQKDGSVNFLVEFKSASVNPASGKKQATFYFINAPFNYNPTTDFTKSINVTDRNNSNKIRTWAGDDTIYDNNSVNNTTIDGGLGTNKVVYKGLSSTYTVTKNNDGSYNVKSNNISDKLVRIHSIVFDDKTMNLN